MQGQVEGAGAPPRPPAHALRVHQRRALEAIEQAESAGARRAWVVLPPGAGKTLVGLETARRRGRTTVVLGPNTAIQTQWLRGWDALEDDAGQRDEGHRRAVHGADVPVAGDVRRPRHRRRRRPGRHQTKPVAPRRPPPQRPSPRREAQAGRRPHARARRVPPPPRGVGPAAPGGARPAAERVRARADRDPTEHPDPGPEGARRRAVRGDAVHREHPGGRARGRPGAVRRARLADHPDAERGRLAGRAGRAVRRADDGAERPVVRLDQLLRLARQPLHAARRARAHRRGPADGARRTAPAATRRPRHRGAPSPADRRRLGAADRGVGAAPAGRRS